MDELELIEWNCYSGNDRVAETLQEWGKWLEPDGFALSEAANHRQDLLSVPGYRLLQEKPVRNRKAGAAVDDTGDCALLLATHVEVRNSWVDRMTRYWTVFSHRRRHKPHRYQVARIKVRGRVWRVRSSHWPTNGLEGGNREAVLESARSSRRWLLASLGTPSIDVGDLNEKDDALARWYGPRFKVWGRGIDLAVTRHVADCSWERLGKGGSDAHYGRRFRFQARSRR
jgi:hypothetical protein